MNVFGRRILSTPRVLARFSSTTTVVPPHPPASATPTFTTETAVSDYPQAPNHPGLWSENQRPRPTPATGPRFEQTAMQLQPQPLSAMEMIANEPIRLSKTRIAACDGGAYRIFPLPRPPLSPPPSLPRRPASRTSQLSAYPVPKQYTDSPFLYRAGGGPLGHPKIFINLVRPWFSPFSFFFSHVRSFFLLNSQDKPGAHSCT